MVTTVEPQFTDGEAHSVEEVSRVSKDLMDTLTSRGAEVARAPGLLITNEDVRRIRRYVNTGLELPTALDEVSQLTGGRTTAFPALGQKRSSSCTSVFKPMPRAGRRLKPPCRKSAATCTFSRAI